MAAEQLSLMEFVHALLADAQLRVRFADDPRGTLATHGLGDLGQADVHDALVLVQDNEITDYSHGPTHPQASWDAEAFGRGGAGAAPADHVPWPALDQGPPEGPWAGWPADHAGSADSGLPDPGWADDGYGTGLDAAAESTPGPDGSDVHHHG